MISLIIWIRVTQYSVVEYLTLLYISQRIEHQYSTEVRFSNQDFLEILKRLLLNIFLGTVIG